MTLNILLCGTLTDYLKSSTVHFLEIWITIGIYIICHLNILINGELAFM